MKQQIICGLLFLLIIIQGPVFGKGGENQKAKAFAKIPEKHKLTIFFTNDLQAHLLPDREGRGGLAKIAYLVKEEKKRNPNTLLLDAGDMSVGTVFGSESKGEAVFRVMNVVGYDAAVYGNHEFDQFGIEQARRYQAIAKFPLLASNLRTKDAKPFSQDYKIFSFNNLRVAVLGISAFTNEAGSAKGFGLKSISPEQVIKEFKENHLGQYELLVVLSHQGRIKDSLLANKNLGITLIIGGHNEDKFCEQEKSTKAWVCQAGHYGHYLGKVEFYWNSQTKIISEFKKEMIEITQEMPEDIETRRSVANELANLPENLKVKIGTSSTEWDESWVGNWVAELLKFETNADLGIINSQGIRGKIYPGEIKAMDIYEIVPFQDRICVFEVSPAGLNKVKSQRGLYFSRVNQPLPQKPYKVSTVDFLCKTSFKKNCSEENCSQTLLRDKIIERVKKDKGFKYLP